MTDEERLIKYFEDQQKRIESFRKYMKRQSFHVYIKKKMVNRFNELFPIEKNENN